MHPPRHPIEIFPRLNLINRLAERLAIENHVGIASNDQACRRRHRFGLHPSVLNDLDLGIPARKLVYTWDDDLELHVQLLKDLPPLRRAGGEDHRRLLRRALF